MKIEVKLYHYHDLDLVCLYREGRIGFTRAVRAALNAYGEKEFFRFRMTEGKKNLTARPSYRFLINLDEKTDASAIDVIQRIEPGYRNNFIKTVLRQYICAAIPAEYYNEGEDSYFDDRTEGIYSGKELRDAPLPGRGRAKKEDSHADKESKKADTVSAQGMSDKKKEKKPQEVRSEPNKKQEETAYYKGSHPDEDTGNTLTADENNKQEGQDDLTDMFLEIIG